MTSATLDLNTIVQWLRNQEMNTTRKDNYQTCGAFRPANMEPLMDASIQ